jgi:hypothetical protein
MWLAALRRQTVTSAPAAGDYILNPTGYSWNVRRSSGEGSFHIILVGERNRTIAAARAISLADSDKTNAWETAGTGVFWLLKRCRR